VIDINNESGQSVNEKSLVKLARFALDLLHIHPDAELSIVLVDEATMSVYHEKFMGEPGPTDVLSFPMDELRPGQADQDPPTGVLGDVVLCPSVIQHQADEMDHTFNHEAGYLLVHGLLHLLGFDHGEPEEKAVMFALNDQIMQAWEKRKVRN